MQKKVYIIISLLLTVIGIFLLCNKSSNEKTFLDEVKLKDVEEENSMFAIMVQDGENYIPYDQETWPTDDYTFNGDKSGCLDSEGKKIEGINLSFDESTKKVKVETDVTSYCYIYFDKEPTAGDTLKDKVGKGGLKQIKDDTELKYRYIGACNVINGTITDGCDGKVDNFICLGTTDAISCKATNWNAINSSKYLYRIIGITDDNKLKVIKNSSIGENRWHSGYSGNSNNAVWDVANSDKKESELHQKLNSTTFLNYTVDLSDEWIDKIMTTSWYIGDSKIGDGADGDGIGYGTGKTETGLQVWTWEKEATVTTPSKIGLMYLSDYYYSLDGTGSKNCYNDSDASKACKTSWLHLSNNGVNATTSSKEWTMSRYGKTGSNYVSWSIYDQGKVALLRIDFSYLAVRPVFYLKPDVKITSGTGTASDPFLIS